MSDVRSCAPIPWWIWAQLVGSITAALLTAFWMPLLSIMFSVGGLAATIRAAQRTLRRRAYVVRQRGMLQAEVVPPARPAIAVAVRQVGPVRQRALPGR